MYFVLKKEFESLSTNHSCQVFTSFFNRYLGLPRAIWQFSQPGWEFLESF